MAKYCKRCNKKIGFFDTFYEDKYCEECYKEKIERIKESERQEREWKQRKAKEQARNIGLEKLDLARNYLLYTNYYWVIIKNIDFLPFHYRDIFCDSIRDKFEINYY